MNTLWCKTCRKRIPLRRTQQAIVAVALEVFVRTSDMPEGTARRCVTPYTWPARSAFCTDHTLISEDELRARLRGAPGTGGGDLG